MASRSSSSSDVPTPSISLEEVDVDVDVPVPSAVETPAALAPAKSSLVKPKSSSASPLNQLRIEFIMWRIIALAVLTLGIVAAVLASTFKDGIQIAVLNNATQSKEVLDDYNSKAATVMSVVNKLVDLVLEIFVAIAFLAFFAKWTTQSESTMFKVMAPILAATGLSFLVCNGPTAINVRIVAGPINAHIVASDLARIPGALTEPPLTGNGTQLLAPLNKTYSETAPGNPVSNTVLRTKFESFQRAKTRCTAFGGIFSLPTVSSIIQSEAWLLTALPAAVEPVRSFTLYPLAEGSYLGNHTEARTLFVLSTMMLELNFELVLYDETRAKGGIISYIKDSLQKSLALTSPGKKLADIATYGKMLDDFDDDRYLKEASQAFASVLPLISNDSSAVYHTHEIADSITFTSLTVEMSINSKNSKQGQPDEIQDLLCSEEGCMASMDELFGKEVAVITPRVGIAGLQNISNQTNDFSNGPLAVLSIAKRLEGDSFDVNETSRTTILTGLRMKFTVTVGLLSWKLDQLDQVLGAKCNLTSGCEGLKVNSSRLWEKGMVALVGRSAMAFSELESVGKDYLGMEFDTHSPSLSSWTNLVTTSSQDKLDVIFPRNFKNVGENVAPFLVSRLDKDCLSLTDRYIKGVEINHLYMEDSLQTGYTAAFHYLVQNAVLHKRLDASGSVELLGNYQRGHVMASIPLQNAATSLVGCVVLVSMCVAIVAVHKQGKNVIEANSRDDVIAQAMLNSSKFPRLVLSLWIDRPDSKANSQLDDVIITKAEFENKPKPKPSKNMFSRVKPAKSPKKTTQ